VRDQPARGRFERDGGERTAQIGLVEANDATSRRCRVDTESTERQLIAGGEQNDGVGTTVPLSDEIRMGHGEIESGMRCLTCLRPRRKISTGDEIEARKLLVRHVHHDSHRPQPPVNS
jgi:hypothetical protein